MTLKQERCQSLSLMACGFVQSQEEARPLGGARGRASWTDRLAVQLGDCDSLGEAFIRGKPDDNGNIDGYTPRAPSRNKTLTQTTVSRSSQDLGEAARGGSEGLQWRLELSHAGEGDLGAHKWGRSRAAHVCTQHERVGEVSHPSRSTEQAFFNPIPRSPFAPRKLADDVCGHSVYPEITGGSRS